MMQNATAQVYTRRKYTIYFSYKGYKEIFKIETVNI